MLTITGGGHQVGTTDYPIGFLRWSLYGGEPPRPPLGGAATLDDQLARSSERTLASRA
jgi:hypothetical protein